MRALLRTLSPLGWTVLVAAVVVGGAIVLGGLGFRWDPFDVSRRRADQAEEAMQLSQAEAAARTAEAVGQAGQVARLDAALETSRSLDRATILSIQNARTADDANLPLSTDRIGRLREHDRQLCRIAPDLDGCPAAPDPAGDGGEGV